MAGNQTFPVTGHFYDLDATTVVDGARILYRNATKGEEKVGQATNSLGEFSVDFGDLTTQWEVGDVLYIVASISGRHAVARMVINTGQISWEQELYAKSGKTVLDDVILYGLTFSVGATAQTISVVEKDTDIAKLIVNVAANSSHSATYQKGIVFSGGFYIIRSGQTLSINNQARGAANALGDISTNVLIATAVSYKHGIYQD